MNRTIYTNEAVWESSKRQARLRGLSHSEYITKLLEQQAETFVADNPKVKVELRDFFLAHVVQGICARSNTDLLSPREIAELAAKITDEVMLRSR